MTAEGIAAVPRLRKRTWVLLGFGGVVLAVLLWSALGGPGIGGDARTRAAADSQSQRI